MAVLSKSELKKAEEAFKELKDNVQITVIRNNSGKLCKEFEEIAESISGLSDKIEYTTEKRNNLLAYPALLLKKDGQENIYYHALPLKKEFKPFINTIVNLSKGATELKKETLEKLKKHEKKATLISFITPPCPYCARVVQKSNSMAIEDPGITSYVVDITCFEDLKERYDVMSAPLSLVNEKIKLEGESSEKELAEWIATSEKSNWQYHYLGDMLKNGQMKRVVSLIKEDASLVPVLGELIAYPDFNGRVGAMVALEELVDEDPQTVSDAVPKIISLLDTEDDRLKGDAAMALGIAGHKKAIPALKKLLDYKNQDVREAAREAIEDINKAPN